MPLFQSPNLKACCAKPSILKMDSKAFANAEGKLFIWQIQGFTRPVQVTNQMCTRCGAHWYGEDGDIKQFTAKEWAERNNAC